MNTAAPVSNLQFKEQYKGSFNWDFVFNHKLQQLAVRTNDINGPIKVFDLCGTLLSQFGKGIQGLDSWGRLTLDPKRDLYLAPCKDYLRIIDTEGTERGTVQVKDSDLRGVAYSGSTDQYVLTDINNHRVVIMDPNSMKLVNSFGSKGSGDNQFNRPLYVCVGDIQGRATIVVSDSDNHAVKLFDLSGRHIDTYGSLGCGEGQLECPLGVAVDPAGRVIVLDSHNFRVLSVLDHEDVQLLSENHLGGCPTHVDIDIDNKLVAIAVDVPSSHAIQLYTY